MEITNIFGACGITAKIHHVTGSTVVVSYRRNQFPVWHDPEIHCSLYAVLTPPLLFCDQVNNSDHPDTGVV